MSLIETGHSGRLTRVLEAILSLLMFGIFAMVVLLVILRYVFNTTIIGGNEATVVAFVYTTAIGAAVSIASDEHISIRYFTDKLSVRTQSRVTRLQLILVALINAVIGIYALAWIQRTGGFLMPALGLPQWVAQLSIPIGCALSVVYCLLRWRDSAK